MSNIFKECSHHLFSWDKIGNIKEGRSDLGEDVPVIVYRLMEYSMNHILTEEYGEEQADILFRKTGHLAGSEFAKNMLDLTLPPEAFFSHLQKVLTDLKIGILRIESIDEKKQIILTIGQDLDCSGLPATNETVCCYDEGFLSGILEVYTKNPYTVREIDCWASGARVCRFCCTSSSQE